MKQESRLCSGCGKLSTGELCAHCGARLKFTNGKVSEVHVEGSNHEEVAKVAKTLNELQVDSSNWSDTKKWIMGIVAALVIAAIIALAKYESPPSITLEPDEIEVHNEWVIQIAIANNLQRIKEFKGQFYNYYKLSGDKVWENDIRTTRSPSEKGKWLLVIDTFPGRSEQKTVKTELRRLKRVATRSRDLSNTLGTFFTNAKVIDWNLGIFISTYGKPLNIPIGDDFTSRDAK